MIKKINQPKTINGCGPSPGNIDIFFYWLDGYLDRKANFQKTKLQNIIDGSAANI